MRGLVCISFLIGVLAGSSVASAAEVRQGPDPLPAPSPVLPGLSLWAIQPMEPMDVAPGFYAPVPGMVADRPFASSTATPPADFSADYIANLYGGEVGLFGGYNDRPTVFESVPTTGWNVGASLGYAGFYVRAGISDSGANSVPTFALDTHQGWLAGLGFRTGGLNLRLTYMAAQSSNLTGAEEDSRTWMIGGIYQLTPRIRLNADAFTSRDLRTLGAVPSLNNAATPQGNGARLGIQLRF